MANCDGPVDNLQSEPHHIPNLLHARKILKQLELLPKTTDFLCCSRCFTLHREWDDRSAVHVCNVREALDPSATNICGTALVIKRRKILVQSLIDWIGRMLSRRDIEQELEVASYQSRPPLETISSILDGAWVRSLMGLDGRPFLPSSSPELNLLLSLNVDSFHPLGLKPAGSHYSSTGIYMTLLSLPASIRYKKENMFLFSIIPGPSAPHAEYLNSILMPLLDELEILWSGVYYSCTALKPDGRLVRVCMACVVCDLLAALQVAGLASHSSDILPCAFCHIRGSEMKQKNQQAPLRSRASLERLGNEWLKKDSALERKKHFKCHGVRFTALSRLSYWDITRSKVVDAMHTFMLDGLSRHISSLLGMDSNIPDANEICAPQLLSEADLFDAELVLWAGKRSQVEALGRIGVVSLCHARGLRHAGGIKTLIAMLWVPLI
jgi:Transposase family tnp2